jgi:hypothetical protein
MLAEGRRQAGLTVTQVSQCTCIRETIIRGIERGDFSGCGGDFYARGHVRSIARAVGLDPEPLSREYDRTLGEPRQISAAEVFQPVTPVKLKEQRRPNWTATLAVALLVVLGILAYQHFASGQAAAAGPGAAAHQARTLAKASGHGSRSAGQAGHGPAAAAARRVVIRLSAVQNCWIQLATLGGRSIFSGMVYAGSSMAWTERHTVTMVIGNPSGIRLRVNGKDPVPAGTVSTVTLTLRPPRA